VAVLAEQQSCELVWENRSLSSPSAVPKVSLANGLVYLYTRDDNNPDDLHAWYLTAVDVETGQVAYKQLTGVGWLFNNHYGSITISPDGVAYVGIMGGLVKIKDGP
jgi:outer membrane protein assembly factor BamB